MLKYFCFALVLFCFNTSGKQASFIDISPNTVNLSDDYTLVSLGAYRIKAGTYGSSRLAYTSGAFTVSDDEKILYIAGHSQHFSIGAFEINKEPRYGPVERLPVLPSSQPFIKVHPNFISDGAANRITGIEILDDSLLVMTDEYYDANTNNVENLVVFENRYDLQKSEQKGFFELTAHSHAAGWMSKIPDPLAKELDALYLSGNASNLPIDGRLSIGPTMFTWYPYFLNDSNPKDRIIMTRPLIDYSLSNPLNKDQYNKSKKNKVWTEVSKAFYGFISPNLKHYIVLGTSGGNDSGIGYKIKQNNGHQCGGPCTYDYKDNYNYYWIYSIKDTISSKNGTLKPHEVRPISFGKLEIFDFKYPIIGADFNPTSNNLYLLINNLDTTQNIYETQPLLLKYKLKANEEN